jgi:hypothetical protein
MIIHYSSIIGICRVRIDNVIIPRFRRSYLSAAGVEDVEVINSLKSGFLNWVTFSRWSLVQFWRKAFRTALNLASTYCFSFSGSSSMFIGWLMLPSWGTWVLSLVSSTLLPMLLEENLIFRLAFSSGVVRKYVDAEDRSKPTHQRGPWTSKRSHKTCNTARDAA